MTNIEEAALCEINQGVATITLNRPENKNALSVEMVNALGDHFNSAQENEEVRLILFTNVGNTFCACLLYTSPSPRDQRGSRMPSSA